MSSTDDMDARHGRILAELAEAGIDLVRRVSSASHEAASVEDFVRLTQAFQTASRSVRQTIALEFKLRYAPREPAPPRPEPAPAAAPPPERPERPDRPEQVYWNEYERPDWDEPLDALLDQDDRAAINAAVDDSIARIRRDLTKAEGVLADAGPPARPPGPTSAAHLLSVAPKPRPQSRNALLSTSSRPGLDLKIPPGAMEAGPRAAGPSPPPWRRSD